MEELFHLYIICLMLLCGVVGQLQPPDGYRSWTPRNINITDLLCPIRCHEETDQELCCLCEARECWDIYPDFCNLVLRMLHVEYTDINGSSRVLHIGSAVNETVDVLKHIDGNLRIFPTNLNDYKNIVKIDLSRNRIKEIPNITFLKVLSVLVLDGNLVTYISNNTFIGQVRLRHVSLAQNSITYIEPYSFFTRKTSIFKVNISRNQLTEIDATLLAPPSAFCVVDASKNSIEHMTNPTAYILNLSQINGPGKVTLQQNHFNLPNLTEIGALDWVDFGKYSQYGWDINNQTDLKCDCVTFHYFEKLKLVNLERILKDYNNLSCSSPDHFRGVGLLTLYGKGNYDDLICNITIDCPRHCHCYDQPSRSNVVVDCEGKCLTDLPEGPLPTGYWGNQRLELRLGNNSITKLEKRDYMDRIVSMNLTGNPITSIEDSAATAMRNDIQLSIPNCQLQTLPSSFKYLDPNKVNFGENIFLCSCDIAWMSDWQYKLYGNNTAFFCSKNDKIMSVREIVHNLHCKTQSDDVSAKIIPSSLVAFGICLLVIAACLYFRYEIRILFARVFSSMAQTNIIDPKVFISHDESNDDIRVWIKNDLYPNLCCEGVNTILPCRNFLPGANREQEYNLAIPRCNAYIVILSQYYNQPDSSTILEEQTEAGNWTKTEFSYIWNECFNSGKTKLLIVVNFDHLCPAHYRDKRLRALCRVGNVLDFHQREEKMLIRIKKMLNISQRCKQPLQESLSIVTSEEINDTVTDRMSLVRRHDSRKNISPQSMESQIPTFEETRRYHFSKSDCVARTSFRPSGLQSTFNLD